ncbi:helix-turn-helix domain-containing protein [Pseudomonas alliivorans]|nr:AraC family transcriptional regulator [Pseudomonas alliivorans]MEE4306781.1 helix-turn-helix domain-containing protein [Pseudomonas alliivorans]MEE4571957.1 helix-turn-helix domain-containing protein [Pseudomonas alliivorans]MEE4879871.1 helix-turn-helix domain-containing protein [Pseudomonas alliivorans]MEE4887023.1 helix-turn-helix domain-containing protein [Pseudomonas alliivorans]MEE4932637.1 helix-turn-helix domain-containing protein [Pseudomonas alliivorans]
MNGRRSSALEYSVWPGWRLLMQDAGVTAPPVLRRAQLPGDLFARRSVRLNSADFFRLWEAIEAEAQSLQPTVPTPLQIARVMSSDWFDPELFAALCSAHMRGAMERLATYIRLIAPMAIRMVRNDKHTTITLDFLTASQPPPAVFLIFKMVLFVQLARLATRTQVNPLQISWPLPDDFEKDSGLYAAFFGTPVTHSAVTTLVLDNADMDRPFLTENHKMWLFFEPDLRQRLSDLDRTCGMLERVRSALLESLPAGEVSMQAVGRKLGVSTRTLQRRLQSEGTSFQQILDTLRESLAHHYLRNTAMSSAEISFLLGFEDPNSFARAFQVWTGKTPGAVRNEKAADEIDYEAGLRLSEQGRR